MPYGEADTPSRRQSEASQGKLVPYEAKESEALQDRLNKRLGPEFLSHRPGPGGRKIAYISGDKSINLANYVFGFNGWSSRIQDVTVDFVDEMQGRISVGISVTIRITLQDGSYREDVGYGEAENIKGKAMAFGKAKKSAITDGLKRTLRQFGEIFMCAHDNDFVKRVLRVKAPMADIDEGQLYRHPDVKTKQSNAAKPAIKDESADTSNIDVSNVVAENDEFGDFEDYGLDDDDMEGLGDDETLMGMLPPTNRSQNAIVATKPAQPDRSMAPPPQRQQAPQQNNRNNSAQYNNNQDQIRSQAPPPVQATHQQPQNRVEQTVSNPMGAANNNLETNKNPFGPDIDIPQPAENPNLAHLPPGAFFSARATLDNVEIKDGGKFNPMLQSPSIKKTAGVDHSKSSPVPRARLGAQESPGPSALGRPNFQQPPGSTGFRPMGVAPMAVPGNKGFRAPTIAPSNTGQKYYPPLAQKRNSDGVPVQDHFSNRPILADATNRQMNSLPFSQNPWKKDIDPIEAEENLTKRVKN